MRVEVQFFSQLKEIADGEKQMVELPNESTVGQLLARLYEMHPGLAKWDRTILVGVGLEFVERDHVIQPGDQVAIMPPLQGG